MSDQMDDNNNNNTNKSNLFTENSGVSEIQRSITIPILVFFAFPSFLCFLFIFYHMIRLRQRLIYDCITHHIILLILIMDFLLISTELPISLYYLGLGNVHTRRICIFWIYWDYMLETTSLFLVMYASIERYLSIFCKYSMKRHPFLLHYIPMSCVGLYIPLLYFYLVVLSPCAQHHLYDLSAFVCGGACFFSQISVNTYDTVVDTMLPCFIILIFNLIIILRLTIIKARALKSTSLMKILRKNRRIILQLFGISLMSLTTWMPWVVIIIVQNFFEPSFGNWFIQYILHYLPYVTTSVSPFLALIGLPEIRKNFKLWKYQTKSSVKITNEISLKVAPPVIINSDDLIISTRF